VHRPCRTDSHPQGCATSGVIPMHDARALLDPATDAVRKLARRGYQLDLDLLSKLVSERSAIIQSGDDLRAESKTVASQVRTAKSAEERASLVERAREL